MLGRITCGVAVAALFALGCSNEKGPVDYHTNVAPIMAERCNACHVTGGTAPFELGTYEQATAVAPLLKDAVVDRTMPPWGVDSSGTCQTFHEPRWLEQDEIDTITTWVDEGLREGAFTDPPQPNLPTELDEVDVKLEMEVTYTPNAATSDDYRCFVIDPQITEDQFIIGANTQPGALSVVHHVILFVPLDLEASQAAEALDAAEPGPGYTCYGGPGVDALVGPGWAPGTPAGYLPKGTGYPMVAGTKMVMQVHYNLLAGLQDDLTTMELDLAPNVEFALINVPLAAGDLVLPPGESYVEANYTITLPPEVPKLPLYGVFPHMHTLGVDLYTERTRGSTTECLTKVDRWDFNWQQAYLYQEPLDIDGQDVISLRCGYDTTGRTDTVYWGDGTQDEMCLNFLMVGVPPAFLPATTEGGMNIGWVRTMEDLAKLQP